MDNNNLSNSFPNPQTPGLSPQPTPPSGDKPKKSAKILAALILIVVLLGVGGVVILNKDKGSTSNTSTTPQTLTKPAEAVVSITAQGFSPATLQVSANTQVTWTNNDKSPHRLAADPYPQDDSIPGFNKDKIVLQKGDSYSFIFSQAGTYTYHDELNPLKLKGSVVVK